MLSLTLLLILLPFAHSAIYCYPNKCYSGNGANWVTCDLEYNHCSNSYNSANCVSGWEGGTSITCYDPYNEQVCSHWDDGSPHCIEGSENYTVIVGPVISALIFFAVLFCCIRCCCRRRARNRGLVIQAAAHTTVIQNNVVVPPQPLPAPPPPAASYQNPPHGYYPAQPVYPGQAGAGYAPQQPMPGQGYAPQQGAGYAPQQPIPGQGYPPQQGAGYAPQPQQPMPGQNAAGYPPQPIPGQGGPGYAPAPQQVPAYAPAGPAGYSSDAPPNYNEIVSPPGPTNNYGQNPYFKE